jgi:hypothetical protein
VLKLDIESAQYSSQLQAAYPQNVIVLAETILSSLDWLLTAQIKMCVGNTMNQLRSQPIKLGHNCKIFVLKSYKYSEFLSASFYK